MRRLAHGLLLLTTAATLAVPTMARAGCSSLYPVTDKRVANYECTGIHPGTPLRIPSKKYGELQCAAGFFFTDQTGARYTSVPGTCHLDFDCLEDVVVDQLPPPLDQIVGDVVPCLLPEDSELEPNYGRRGPAVHDLDGDRIGSIVYAVNKKGIDFALIRIDAGVKIDPAVPLYGGPTRLAGPDGTAGEQAYSYGPTYGSPAPNASTGLLTDGGDRLYHQTGRLATSGNPVLRPDGGALGYYSGSTALPTGSIVLLYGPALARLELHTRIRVKIMTAKVAA